MIVPAGILTTSLADAALINGDFETGDLTGWDFTPDPLSDPGMSPQVAIFDGSNAFRVNAGKSFLAELQLEEYCRRTWH